MELPIDARHAPFREKYLDEETPMLARWMIFGYDDSDGTLHIADANQDIFRGLTAKQAAQVLIARDEFVQRLLRVLNGSLDFEGDRDFGITIRSQEAEIERLRWRLRLAQRQYERLALCPDHRDKANGKCLACQVEHNVRQEIKHEQDVATKAEGASGDSTRDGSNERAASAPGTPGLPDAEPAGSSRPVAAVRFTLEIRARVGRVGSTGVGDGQGCFGMFVGDLVDLIDLQPVRDVEHWLQTRLGLNVSIMKETKYR